MSEPKRILLVRLSALGDVLLATPAVRALKRRFPDAEIDWLVERPYLPLVEENPHAAALGYDKRGEHRGLKGWLKLRRQLEERDYDLVIDLQGKPKTALLRSVARDSLAMQKRTPLEAARALFGDDPPLVRAHAVDLFLEALRPLGVEPDGQALELKVSESSRQEARELPAGRLVGLAPGARWATKRWPAEHFAQLAQQLGERGFTPVLFGGPGDRNEIDAVRAAMPAGMPLVDTMSLSVGGLAAAISWLEVLVAGDSGPVHIASALGTPVVALFGPTSPARWRPLSPASEVMRRELPCSPCTNHGGERCPKGHHDCLRQLEVAPVLEAALRLRRPAVH